ERYKARRDVVVEGLHQAGWDIPAPPATMFAWAPVPPAFRELGSLAFSKMLLEEANVAVSPGNGFGEYGENYVRIALVENCQRLRQACRKRWRFMSAHGVNAVASPRPPDPSLDVPAPALAPSLPASASTGGRSHARFFERLHAALHRPGPVVGAS